MKPLYSNKYYNVLFDALAGYYVADKNDWEVSPFTPDLYMAIGWAESAELARMVEELELDSSGDEWAEEM